MFSRMVKPDREWDWIKEYSTGESFVGLLRISAGIDSLPMSWTIPAMRRPSTLSSSSPISRAIATDSRVTRSWWPAV
jgi:hypothetical protein